MALDISNPPDGLFCVACLMENLAGRTSDATALSDVRRIHRAFHRGHDTTRVAARGPVRVDLPLKPVLIDLEDVNTWFETVGALMRPTTLDVYTSTYARALGGLHCHHNGEQVGSPSPATPRATLEHLGQGDFAPRGAGGFTSTGPSTGRMGFKLSVAQKCLSLALKHAYAHGVIGRPPVCPVDRIVLNAASSVTGRPWRVNWTDVNKIEEYDRHFDLLNEAAGFRGIADWELLRFEQIIDDAPTWGANVAKERRLDQLERLPLAKLSFLRRFGGVPAGDHSWPEAMLKDALRSSLQHNPTYLQSTPEHVRITIRQAMRRHIAQFLQRWTELSPERQTVAEFRQAIAEFRDEMNIAYGKWFR